MLYQNHKNKYSYRLSWHMVENKDLEKNQKALDAITSDSDSTELNEKNQFITDALNIHGSFFHKKCIEVIANQYFM